VNSSMRAIVTTATIALLAGACGRDSPEPVARDGATPTETPHAPQLRDVSRQDLEELTLHSEFAGSGGITLIDGVYQEPAEPGSATTTIVMLTDQIAFGDLDGDGVGDAIAIIETDPGGSGVFFELVAVVATPSGARPVATASLGDRTDIEAVAISGGVVTVDLVTQGPEDPMCCPTAREQRIYRLVGDALVRENGSGEPMLVQGSG
jgi:hypothetical protein